MWNLYVSMGCSIYSLMTWQGENSSPKPLSGMKTAFFSLSLSLAVFLQDENQRGIFIKYRSSSVIRTFLGCIPWLKSTILSYSWSGTRPDIWTNSNRNCSSMNPLQFILAACSSTLYPFKLYFLPCFLQCLKRCGYNLPLDSVVEQIPISCLFSLMRPGLCVKRLAGRRIGTAAGTQMIHKHLWYHAENGPNVYS